MSYSRHYHEVVRGSVSVSVSDGKGGSYTKSVSYTHPIDIYINVDTELFDKRVRGCSASVDRLTGAVVATQSAEVASRHKASRKVAGSILRGFFSYISTDLSQQIKELISKTGALLVEMGEQSKDCLHRKEQMGGDFTRISTRYATLFADLDKELDHRIRNLCRPIFSFAEAGARMLQRPMDGNLLGTVSVAADEAFRLDAVLKCSSIKHRAQELIDGANRYLEGTYRLQNTVRDILYADSARGVRYLPVAYVESTVSAQGVDRRIYGADNAMLAQRKGIENDLKRLFQEKRIDWTEMDDASAERIRVYFDEELGRSGVSPRVASVIRSLRANNRIRTIKK